MGDCFRLCVCSPHGTVLVLFTFIVFVLVFMLSFFHIKNMDIYHAASWSDPCYTSSEEEEENLYTALLYIYIYIYIISTDPWHPVADHRVSLDLGLRTPEIEHWLSQRLQMRSRHISLTSEATLEYPWFCSGRCHQEAGTQVTAVRIVPFCSPKTYPTECFHRIRLYR